MIHYCAHCDYNSERMYNLKVHQRNKHNIEKEQVHQQPIQTQPTDWNLMEDSIQVFKIYKLLQRMKNK